jgi:hypothetical protein
MRLPQHIKLKENSWLAKIAAAKLGSSGAALVLGSTIHLYNITEKEFLSSPQLVRHELKHVEQYKRLGVFTFLAQYFWFSARYGYHKNPLEKEARQAENYALEFESEGQDNLS